MKIALITGATSGIGEAIALKFAQKDINVIITGRRLDKLNALKSNITSNTKANILALKMDVTDRKSVERVINGLPDEWKSIDILVNNAGLAVGLDPIQHGNPDDWEQMIDTNLKGLLYVSKAVLPLMIARQKGHIINIGSIAGKEVYPKGNVYCATKHAVDALTKSMRIDLLGNGIKVTQIAPGLVETEFSLVRFKGDEERASKVYQGYKPLEGKDIAEIAFFITTLPDHVCVNDILMTPLAQANSTIVDKK
ncbi:MAG: SDR family NAD(P)-dependent oxidoreductase [Bacteroidales bacterium]|jgi:3-hydroxy acid dehydrogenase/malonic semialdehyde reductase|nr:SDR family NAD(P)-dependent oxidoreductase [Bacteroidales bacterium]MDI9592498.1 SDR family NAD(P)-dependent oxidoreductase [Bacteroidota bacterium]OQC38279.1 MAG: NADP-dependent 3-hydroxy acid dehydrogenase YdfG [Bacteroidetes bacterium ADurb.Bin041]HNV49653.1 SDR family NAD(P)-dependent oxidoreductase [Bacteroidales bacterium]HOF80246.1 SDR family NAD(P)-dependent oxidoreductase [Bacteroidales bacterium]